MRAKAIPVARPSPAIAFALGLGIAALGAALAHAETAAAQQHDLAITAAITHEVVPPGFVCHARAGGWCDLRDWGGFNQLAAEPGAQQATGENFQ
jgi:hypothetical protein